jgi:hypothetical protein
VPQVYTNDFVYPSIARFRHVEFNLHSLTFTFALPLLAFSTSLVQLHLVYKLFISYFTFTVTILGLFGRKSVILFWSLIKTETNFSIDLTPLLKAHELDRTVAAHINDEKDRCDSEHDNVNLGLCMEEHIQKKAQCQLPWNSKDYSPFPTCTEKEQCWQIDQDKISENPHIFAKA